MNKSRLNALPMIFAPRDFFATAAFGRAVDLFEPIGDVERQRTDDASRQPNPKYAQPNCVGSFRHVLLGEIGHDPPSVLVAPTPAVR
jgi:hypothetical protein